MPENISRKTLPRHLYPPISLLGIPCVLWNSVDVSNSYLLSMKLLLTTSLFINPGTYLELRCLDDITFSSWQRNSACFSSFRTRPSRCRSWISLTARPTIKFISTMLVRIMNMRKITRGSNEESRLSANKSAYSNSPIIMTVVLTSARQGSANCS